MVYQKNSYQVMFAGYYFNLLHHFFVFLFVFDTGDILKRGNQLSRKLE